MVPQRSVAQGTRVAAKRRTRVPWRLFGWYSASVILLVVVWQALGHAFGIVFVPFSTTIANFWTLVRTGVMGAALVTSGKVFGAGLGLCLVIGVVLGLLLAGVRLLSAAIEPYVYLLYSMPTITLVPFVFAAFAFAFAFAFGFWPQVLAPPVEDHRAGHVQAVDLPLDAWGDAAGAGTMKGRPGAGPLRPSALASGDRSRFSSVLLTTIGS